MSQIDLGRQGKDHTIGTPEYQDNTIPSSAVKTSTANIANGIVILDANGKLPTLEGSSLTNLPPASQLTTTSTSVNISNAPPPSAGQVLTATNATHATWQTASGGITGSGTTDKLVKWTGSSTVGNSQITDSSSGITVQAQSGQPVNITGGANGAGSGGNVTIAGGPASGSNPGGGLTLRSGTGQGNGNLSIYTPETLSAPGLSSTSGAVNITSGDAKNVAGDILLTAGKGVGGAGPANDGSITLQLTTASYGTLGNINLNPGSSQVVVNGVLAVKDGTQAAGYVFTSDSNGVGSWQASSGGVSGSGTPGNLSRWTGGSTLGDSLIVDDGSNITATANLFQVVGNFQAGTGTFHVTSGSAGPGDISINCANGGNLSLTGGPIQLYSSTLGGLSINDGSAQSGRYLRSMDSNGTIHWDSSVVATLLDTFTDSRGIGVEGSLGLGKYLTSDTDGFAKWKVPPHAVWQRYSMDISTNGGFPFNEPIPIYLSEGVILKKIVLHKGQDGSIVGTPTLYTVSIGTSTDPTRYTQAYDVIPAVADNNTQITIINTIETFGAVPTQLYFTVQAEGLFSATEVRVFLYAETQSLLLAELL